MECNSCEVLYINGIKTHEHGCPDAWRDIIGECSWCGCDFKPDDKYQTCCSEECNEAYEGFPGDC